MFEISFGELLVIGAVALVVLLGGRGRACVGKRGRQHPQNGGGSMAPEDAAHSGDRDYFRPDAISELVARIGD